MKSLPNSSLLKGKLKIDGVRERVIHKMNNKLLPFLGIAKRAGRLSLGFDMAAEAMLKGKSKLLLLSNDLSQRTQKSIQRTAQQTGTRTIVLDIPMEQLGGSVGKLTGIVSVNDAGFAKKLITLCTE